MKKLDSELTLKYQYNHIGSFPAHGHFPPEHVLALVPPTTVVASSKLQLPSVGSQQGVYAAAMRR